MKNYEKYNEQLKDLRFAEDCNVAYKKMKKSSCLHDGMHCGGCEFRSVEAFLKFMNEEYKEPIQLSNDEYVILKNMNKRYKWMRRGNANNLLYVYPSKPKDNYFSEDGISLIIYSHLFSFISLNGEPYSETYSIEQLIADYEKEHKDE